MNDQSVSGELPFGVRAGVAEDEHVHAPPPLHSGVIFAGEAHAVLERFHRLPAIVLRLVAGVVEENDALVVQHVEAV